MNGIIYLEDGTVYKGKGFGAESTRVGELVFNTAMAGYQGILTDPSCNGQVITMTYPMIGNYGINQTDNESDGIQAYGVIAADVCFKPSNWRSIKTIDQWMKEENIPGVYNVDTREITRKLRKDGSQKCVITTAALTIETLKKICAEEKAPSCQMKKAGISQITKWEKAENKLNVAVLDSGIKKTLLNQLFDRGCNLTIFPYGTKAKTILETVPDGVFLSSGPGNPEEAEEAIAVIEKLITNSSYGPKQMPIFGTGLGHQLIALAFGGNTYKLSYGHRGTNHGVFDKNTGKSQIVCQNHGYAVRAESIVLKGLEVSHLNLNDGTVEGIQHLSKPVFSVQFHPKTSLGATDTGYLFDKFIGLMEGGTL